MPPLLATSCDYWRANGDTHIRVTACHAVTLAVTHPETQKTPQTLICHAVTLVRQGVGGETF